MGVTFASHYLSRCASRYVLIICGGNSAGHLFDSFTKGMSSPYHRAFAKKPVVW